MAQLFAKSLVDLNEYIRNFYHNHIVYTPIPSNQIVDVWLFNLMFWPMVGGISLLWKLASFTYSKFFKRKGHEELIKSPLMLYRQEFAAAMELIDRDDGSLEGAKEFIDSVVETITTNLRLTSKDYRLYFVVNAASTENLVSGLMYGKQLEEAFSSKATRSLVQNVELLFRRDLKFLEYILGREDYSLTDMVISDETREDVNMFLISRNPGRFRLALFIAVLKEDADREEFFKLFPQLSHIITTMAFVDKFVEFMLQYGKEQGGDAS